MEIELQEIVDFVSQQWLFEKIPDATLRTIVTEIEIRYLRRGQPFPIKTLDDKHLYLLRSGAIELRNDDAQLVEKLAGGDAYICECLQQSTFSAEGFASEDTLLYLIPCSLIQSLRNRFSDFDNHFNTSVQGRMKLALQRDQHKKDAIIIHQTVGDLINHGPVIIDADTNIANAAIRMTDNNISSVLILENNQLVGMVCDSDLRSRCLANAISSDRPVRDIMTTQLITIPENTTLSDALVLMTRHQIHHLPVIRAQKPIANLSASELIHYLGTNAAYLATDIDKANTRERLIQIAQHLPELQLQLSMANTSAHQMGEILSSITDSFTRRLLILAERELGDPPVPYVWLAGGSQGRNEQTTHSDQDNALFISNSMLPEHTDYFSQLSRFVSDGLNACGYIYCPGDAMASNPKWRQPVSVWEKYFSQWIDQPEKQALMLSSIFFDLRPVYGERSLYENLQQTILEKTKNNRIFIAFMVANALTHRPPLGFFRHFVLIHDEQHDRTLDIKHRGLTPLIDIARIYALSEGLQAVNTRERLHLACESGAMSQEMSENLIDALEYISSLRNHHQCQQLRRGEQTDNYIDPKALSGLERTHLKDAFMIIKDMQAVLENRYQSARMG